MIRDKYSAVWVSHSSISDYIRCPRAYFLKNVYRDPKTHHKLSITGPSLVLGQLVHEVLDEISTLPTEDRLKLPLTERFDHKWSNIKFRKKIFKISDEEEVFRDRGLKMMQRIEKHPGPIVRKAIKLRQDLPYFWLSEEENIILCGKIDWLEYVEEQDGVRIIDFKTGKFDEDSDSLQLPIYHLLAKNTQNRPVIDFAYWYLEKDNQPTRFQVPDLEYSYKSVLDLAKKISLARKLERFLCKMKQGCQACRPYESILSGEAEFIGLDNYKQDVYILG